MRVVIHKPSDILDYQVDWSQWLDGDTIANSLWDADAGIILSAPSYTSTTTTVWVSAPSGGGVVSNTITTGGGRTVTVSFRLVPG